MPYVPKVRVLVRILFRRKDPALAESLWLEGTWLHDNGDDEGARMAFNHSRLMDPAFAGAHYNYAALTEKKTGKSAEALAAWRDYLKAAEGDRRQAREIVEKVREHTRAWEKS